MVCAATLDRAALLGIGSGGHRILVPRDAEDHLVLLRQGLARVGVGTVGVEHRVRAVHAEGLGRLRAERAAAGGCTHARAVGYHQGDVGHAVVGERHGELDGGPALARHGDAVAEHQVGLRHRYPACVAIEGGLVGADHVDGHPTHQACVRVVERHARDVAWLCAKLIGSVDLLRKGITRTGRETGARGRGVAHRYPFHRLEAGHVLRRISHGQAQGREARHRRVVSRPLVERVALVWGRRERDRLVVVVCAATLDRAALLGISGNSYADRQCKMSHQISVIHYHEGISGIK